MNLSENNSRSREVLDAYWRQGLHELGAALYPAGTVAQPPEYGMIGTKPPSMVVDGLRGDGEPQSPQHDIQPSQLQEHMEQLPEPEVAEPQAPEPDLDIERD